MLPTDPLLRLVAECETAPVTCPTLASVDGMTIALSDNAIEGSTATYTCDETGAPPSEGDAVRACQADGLWSGVVLTICAPQLAWVLVFQRNGYGTQVNRLNELDTLRDDDGLLHFKLEYPLRSERPNFNEWQQSSNPFTTAGAPTGYRPIEIAFHDS
eukprot:COSAG05_NODE_676_length_7987_cov_3.066041_1_plen_157_part_10